MLKWFCQHLFSKIHGFMLLLLLFVFKVILFWLILPFILILKLASQFLLIGIFQSFRDMCFISCLLETPLKCILWIQYLSYCYLYLSKFHNLHLLYNNLKFEIPHFHQGISLLTGFKALIAQNYNWQKSKNALHFCKSLKFIFGLYLIFCCSSQSCFLTFDNLTILQNSEVIENQFFVFCETLLEIEQGTSKMLLMKTRKFQSNFYTKIRGLVQN